MPHTFLFLQGVISPLFPRLADGLAARGHEVRRINFCAGDAALWGSRPALNYRGAADALGAFYAGLFDRQPVTDLVLFGDERPVHRPAIALARQRGIAVHVFEEGYLRPDWFTLERDGVNANSRLPRDPGWYRTIATRLPVIGTAQVTQASMAVRARRDMAYHLANLVNPLAYPGYRTHRPQPALREYLGWARRFAPLWLHRRRDARVIERLLAAGQRYFLVPLQLNADVQITRHSPYQHMLDMLRVALSSFAKHAPADARLVIKNHPLDTGLCPYRRHLGSMASALGIADRLLYLETGHLPTLLDHAAGVITVNSTVGISALLHGAPTIALGEAIYDLPGLTHQGELDGFWQGATPPDPDLFQAFRKTLLHTTQINGNLYTDSGIALAMDACLERMEGQDPLTPLLPEAQTASKARRGERMTA
jgi:capsular polysaccharide export protein